MTNTTINKIILSATTAMFLTACGGGGGGTTPTAAEAASAKIQAYAVDDNAAQPVLADYQALGLTDVNANNIDEYNDLIKAKDSADEVDELSELNAIIAAANANVNAAANADTEAPVITLIGAATVSLTVGDAYTDAGATASDNVDGDITSNIVATTVDTSVVGDYTITYNVSDAAGNAATQVTRTVVVSAVPDTEAPVITLLGDATVDVLINTSYTDAGATASDNIDGDITANIVATTVDTSVAGDYNVTYNVSDEAGNQATQVTRTVKVHATQFIVETDTVKNFVTGLVWDKASTDYDATTAVNPCVSPKTMPTVEQLQSIMVYDNNESAIVDGFTVDKIDNLYYASSDGWKAEFRFGKVLQPDYRADYNDATKTICVDTSNEIASTLPLFEPDENNSSLIKNSITSLVWDDVSVSSTLTYSEAVAKCDSAGKRLPTLAELDGIYDRENNSTIAAFVNLQNGYTWTSTELAANADYGVDKNWFVHLDRDTTIGSDGAIDAKDKESNSFFYTCVQDAD